MTQNLGAIKALQKELFDLSKSPVEGFIVEPDKSNIFLWNVAIFGPPDTLYEGGYFKAVLSFPNDYPYSPPEMKFKTRMFHPNIYANGDVCISILHRPGEDEQSGELASERWNPTQNVRTILLSVISMLNEPNINSPANVNASVAYKQWCDSKGKEDKYETRVHQLVKESALDAECDNVKVPTTLEEYLSMGKNPSEQSSDTSGMGEADDMDEHLYQSYEDDDDDADFEYDEVETSAAAAN